MKAIDSALFGRQVPAHIGAVLDVVTHKIEFARDASGVNVLGDLGPVVVVGCERKLGVVTPKFLQASRRGHCLLDTGQLKHVPLDTDALLALHKRLNKLGVIATVAVGGEV